MGNYSKETIKHALMWEGDSATDDDGSDYNYEVLEDADPQVIAAVKKELAENNYGLSLPLHQTPGELTQPETRKDREARKAQEERKFQRSLPYHFIQD